MSVKHIQIRVKKLDPSAIIPMYQTPQAAGFDLHAISDYVLEAHKSALIGTGLAFEIESHFEIQIRPRSGLALKHGISVLNTPGTIDSDYRGEIKVLLINHSSLDFHIHKGDRIAQAVVNEITHAQFSEVEELQESVRGEKGFGSSGVAP